MNYLLVIVILCGLLSTLPAYGDVYNRPVAFYPSWMTDGELRENGLMAIPRFDRFAIPRRKRSPWNAVPQSDEWNPIKRQQLRYQQCYFNPISCF